MNQDDKKCPICLEAYTPQKQRDGVRNRKINCSHYCCVPCWLDLYDSKDKIKRCPICKANLTEWLEDNHINHLGDYP